MIEPLEVEIRDAPPEHSKRGIIGCKFTCVKCRQILFNDGRGLWPWYAHECYKHKRWMPRLIDRQFLNLVIYGHRVVKSIDLRSRNNG